MVVILQGRYAGSKAVIVKSYDDGNAGGRSYGHCLVVGLSKPPRKVTRKSSPEKQAKRSSLKAFCKLVNYNHVMPTRYTLDVDFKGVVNYDNLAEPGKKRAASKECKKLLEEKFKTGKNRWFFTKLRF